MKKILSKKITVLCLVFTILLLVFGNLFYNNQKALAQQKQTTCDPQIPIGESIERTGELINSLIQELRKTDQAISEQIDAAQNIISLSGQCDTSLETCHPTGCTRVGISCQSQACTSLWQGQACPQSRINEETGGVEAAYNKINASKQEITALINGTDGSVDERVSLCSSGNEDIRTPAEIILCAGCPVITACPKISKIELISRKLDRSRASFDSCSLSPSQWTQVGQGKLNAKRPIRCDIVVQGGYQRQSPDCRCSPQIGNSPADCNGVNTKSWLNYYCCQ